MPTLKSDIYSHFRTADKKSFIQYAKQGEKVEVISDRGNVLIVKNKAGLLFPCKIEAVVL